MPSERPLFGEAETKASRERAAPRAAAKRRNPILGLFGARVFPDDHRAPDGDADSAAAQAGR